MVYQCHLTKFVILRPLSSKRASEVAFQLLDIFLLFGALAFLQSDNGSEFTAQVITELKVMWPQLTMVHGKPRHPQSQGSVERANSDIKDILVAWMTDNNTQDWTVGLKFVQQQKNSAHHAGIKQTPYKAMFGEDPKVGLTSSSLPQEILERLQSEDDLLALNQPLGSSDQLTSLNDAANETQVTIFTENLPSLPLHASSDGLPLFAADNSTSPLPTSNMPHTYDNSPHSTHETNNQKPPVLHTTEIDSGHKFLVERLQNIANQRTRASESQIAQAKRMVKRSQIELKVGEVGDNVAVPVPLVDRGRGDP
jgi:hypothetical protein